MNTKDQEKTDQLIVRSDLNLEKWPLFTTKKVKGVRTCQRTFDNQRGKVTQKVTIGLANSTETLTITEGKLFYLLLNLWEKAGKPKDGKVYQSLSNVFSHLYPSTGEKDKKSGGWQKKRLLDRVKKMLTIPILYENAYEVADGTVRDLESFTLLKSVHLFDRKLDKQQKYFDFSWFEIHPVIISAILNNRIKPVRLDVLCGLQSDTACLLYRWLDLIMSNATYREFDLDKKFAEDIGIDYSRPDNFLRNINEACKELTGKEISTGKILTCAIRDKKTKGKKIIIQKGKYSDTISEKQQKNHPVENFNDNFDYERQSEDFINLYNALPEEEKNKVLSLKQDIIKNCFGGYDSDLSQQIAFLDAIKKYMSQNHEDAEKSKTI